jgi:hypothetical protein
MVSSQIFSSKVETGKIVLVSGSEIFAVPNFATSVPVLFLTAAAITVFLLKLSK